MDAGSTDINERIEKTSAFVYRLKEEIGKVVVGQRYVIDRMTIGLLTGGHVLLEGVPGLAKTLSVKTLAHVINADFQRIQFTPDLLPADLVGTLIYNPRDGAFTTKRGPIFANIVLADEINRAPAKVQSALLEAMQEGQVTIGEDTHQLPRPFLVMATQNPIEQEGTYPLPEAQIDRFMMKLWVDYPSREEERAILDRMASTGAPPEASPVVQTDEILEARRVVDQVYMDDKIKEYILDLVTATRRPRDFGLALESFIQYGASPRATLYLTLAAKGHAFISGRGYVTPQDVKSIGADVLRHRVMISYEAEAEEMTSDVIVQKIFDGVPVP